MYHIRENIEEVFTMPLTAMVVQACVVEFNGCRVSESWTLFMI